MARDDVIVLIKAADSRADDPSAHKSGDSSCTVDDRAACEIDEANRVVCVVEHLTVGVVGMAMHAFQNLVLKPTCSRPGPMRDNWVDEAGGVYRKKEVRPELADATKH